MVGYLAADWFGKAIVNFLGFLNYGIYSLVKIACLMIINISETTFNDNLLGNFQTRIYIVLAIYMLFKLAFSLLSSIVNPDHLLDKEKGMQKIIPRTIIALCLLIMSPTIFNYAMEWQSDIVALIPRVIIGRTVNTDDDSIGAIADNLSATALSAFVTPNSKCDTEVEMVDSTDLNEVLDATLETCGKKNFKYEFSGLLGLICGIVLIVILITYCVDIAIRVLKLGILKILSPIPIISYIDPKSEKSGAFGNWLKECISTYVELFIKMGILYFVLFVLGNLSNDTTGLFVYPTGAGIVTVGYIKLALIVGSFFFMGKAAQFICNILGIKYDKGSGGVLGKALGIAGGALLGAGIGAAGAVIAGGAGLHGIASAALQGLGGGAGGKPLGSFNKGRDIAAQIRTGDPNAKHKNWLTRRSDAINKKYAQSLGFTETKYNPDGSVKQKGTDLEAKEAMYAAKDEMNNASALRNRFNSGNLTESDNEFIERLRGSNEYANLDDGQILDKYYNDAATNAAKAEKNYSDIKQYASVLGLQTSRPIGEDFKSGKVNPNKYHAVKVTSNPEYQKPTEPTKKTETIPPYNTETKSGILINPSPDMEKKIMDEARKNGQIK